MLEKTNMLAISYIQPEVISLIFALVFLYLDVKKATGKVLGITAMVSSAALLISSAMMPATHPLGFKYLTIDGLSMDGRFLVSLLFIFICLFFTAYGRERKRAGLFLALMHFSFLGSIIMFEVSDLITLLIALEVASLPAYAIVGFFGKESEIEASAKYFTFGTVASAFFVFGTAVLAAFSGEFGFFEIGKAVLNLTGIELGLALIALFVVISAFAYKVAFFPWQFWAPDAYEGQEALSLLYIGIIPKIAGFLAMYRLISYLPDFAPLKSMILIVAVTTLFLANFSALVQNSLPRVIAYSSISQAGFILLAFLVSGNVQDRVLILYLFAYGISNIGFISVLLGMPHRTGEKLTSLSGLSKEAPLAAFLLAVSVLSLAGIPPLPGFFAKVYLFKSLMDVGLTGLVVFAGLMSAVSLGYYLRIIRKSYFEKPLVEFTQLFPARLAISLLVLLVLGFVFYLNATAHLFEAF